MAYFPLLNNDKLKWELIQEELKSTKINNLNDFYNLLSNLGNFQINKNKQKLNSFDYLLNYFQETELILLIREIIKYSLKLNDLIPIGKIKRLNEMNKTIEFNRAQVLCILCHMFLCTVQKTILNSYWVNFQNWLTDSRSCANAYLHSLIEYFKQSFELLNNSDYLNEKIKFELKKFDSNSFEKCLNENYFVKINLKMNGSIGDESNIELDFANMDIGFGISGTQEEILFGSSPELCISMLFCDTMKDNEAIIITGARKVSIFKGYGLELKFKELVPIENKNWTQRIIIAIDALDFSSEVDNLFKIQLKKESLKRELIKSFVGFSAVSNKTIETGHWGCGAFNGNKILKAIIQLISASLTQNDLNYYCFNDSNFYNQFSQFLLKLNQKEIKVKNLHDSLLLLNESETILNELNFIESLLSKI